jgi:hypothetical protein
MLVMQCIHSSAAEGSGQILETIASVDRNNVTMHEGTYTTEALKRDNNYYDIVHVHRK